MKKLAALALVGAAFAATPTYAAVTLPAPVAPCDAMLLNPDALDCRGYYADNWLNEGNDNIELQKLALADLGYEWDGNWSVVDATKVTNAQLLDGNKVDFGQVLYGIHYIGIHFGNAPGDQPQNNLTAFYKMDFGTAGSSFFRIDNTQGFSVAARYPGAVPEPATWMMLLLGFAAVGASLRSRTAVRFGTKGLAKA